MSDDRKYHPYVHLTVPLKTSGEELMMAAGRIDMLQWLDPMQGADNGARAQLLGTCLIGTCLIDVANALGKAQRALESYKIAMDASLVLLTAKEFDALRSSPSDLRPRSLKQVRDAAPAATPSGAASNPTRGL